MPLRNAEITGWGRYIPSLVVTNRDLVDFVDTSDEWIESRTGIKQRHYSHVSTGETADHDDRDVAQLLALV